MTRKLVISGGNLPAKAPIMLTVLLALLIDRWHWTVWVAIPILVFRWLFFLYAWKKEKQYDLFPESVKELEDALDKVPYYKRIKEIIEKYG